MSIVVKLACKTSAFLVLALWTTGCARTSQYYVSKGNKQFAKGKYADAAIDYRSAIQKDPKNGEAYYRLGLVSMEQKKGDEAAAALSQAIELQPDNADAAAKAAEIYLNTYLLDSTRPKAIYSKLTALSDQLLARTPRSFPGLRLKGYLALTDRKPNEAADYFKRAYEVQQTDAGLAASWVQALFEAGRFQEGEALALKLIQEHPTFSGVYDRLVARYNSTNRASEAEKILKTKAANNPRNAIYALELAAYYIHGQRAADGDAVLRRILDDPKDFPNARLQVGDFYSELRDWPKAASYYEEGLRSDTKHALDYQERITDVLLAEGKRTDAVQMVETILKTHRENVHARRVHAALLADSSDPREVGKAISEFQSLIKEDPGNADSWYRLGRIYLNKGDLDAARSNFEQALKVRGDFLLPRYALAQISLQQQHPQAAVRYASEILSVRPNDPQAMSLYASGLFDNGDNAFARRELTTLLKQSPKDADAQFRLGLLDLRERKFKEATELFQNLRKDQGDDPRGVAGLAETYVAQDRANEALQLLNTANGAHSDSPLFRLELARVAIRAHNYKLAAQTYEGLASRNPKALDLTLSLGEAYQLDGNLPRAITTFQDASKIAPKDPTPLVFLGAVLWKANRLQEANESYRHALQLQSSNPSTMNNLAFFLAETGGNLDEALRLVQGSIEKDPQNPNFKDTLGWIYLKRNMTGSALQVFANLARQYPDEPLFRYHWGVALFRSGEKARARSELTAALAKHPQPPDEAKIRDLIAKTN